LKKLGISQEVASALVHAGFSSIEAIQSAEPSDIAQIPGITSDQAKAIFDLAQRKGSENTPEELNLVTSQTPTPEASNT
jgi:transcription termination factor NusA